MDEGEGHPSIQTRVVSAFRSTTLAIIGIIAWFMWFECPAVQGHGRITRVDSPDFSIAATSQTSIPIYIPRGSEGKGDGNAGTSSATDDPGSGGSGSGGSGHGKDDGNDDDGGHGKDGGSGHGKGDGEDGGSGHGKDGGSGHGKGDGEAGDSRHDAV